MLVEPSSGEIYSFHIWATLARAIVVIHEPLPDSNFILNYMRVIAKNQLR